MAEQKIRLTGRAAGDRPDRDSLLLLYMPLTGQDAVILFETLVSLSRLKNEVSQEEILIASGLGEGRAANARKNLEMFGLLDVYEEPVSAGLLYKLSAPLPGQQFLRHEIYGRMLLNTVGSRRFDALVLLFSKGEEVPDGYLRKTVSIDAETLDSQWNAEKEEQLQKLRPQTDVSGFDWDRFYRGRDRELPQRMRTRENEELIANLARLYGLSEDQMRVYVIRACPGPLRILDRESLKNIVRSERRKQVFSHEDPFRSSPVLFLQQRQKGAPVSAADRRLLEKLSEDYRFSNEVMNELLDFVMEQTDGALPTTYVEKIAGTWSRLSIDSRQKAVEWRNRQKQQRQQKTASGSRQSAGLPAWYSDLGEQGPTDDLLAEIDRLRKNDTQ